MHTIQSCIVTMCEPKCSSQLPNSQVKGRHTQLPDTHHKIRKSHSFKRASAFPHFDIET